MQQLNVPVDLIWGEKDPWEPLPEAEHWAASISCVRSLQVIRGAGHCPHDEAPDQVNPLLQRFVQITKDRTVEGPEPSQKSDP